MAIALPVNHICFTIVYPNPWAVLEVKETCRQASRQAGKNRDDADLQLCVTYRWRYVLRNVSLGIFVILQMT